MSRRARVLQLRKRAAFAVFTAFAVFSFGLVLALSICIFTFKSKAHDNTPDINKYYKSIEVEYGTSLYSLALEYNCSDKSDIQGYIDEVCNINHIDDGQINAGDYIIIPFYSSDIIF